MSRNSSALGRALLKGEWDSLRDMLAQRAGAFLLWALGSKSEGA